MANASSDEKLPKDQKPQKRTKHRTSSEQKENRPKTVKKRRIKPDCNNSIAMTKQLRMNKTNRTKRRSRNTPRVCPNGKPLPSLAELEKMFADSDNDDDQQQLAPKAEERCLTPPPEEQKPPHNENKLLSPTTIKKISDRMLEIISNISDPISLIEDLEPPPLVIPTKKKKKSEVPYIVGCKDRRQVQQSTKVTFCKGDKDYGVVPSKINMDEITDDEPPTKKSKTSQIPGYCKSVFNMNSNEIAQNQINEEVLQPSVRRLSDTSDKTIEYDVSEQDLGNVSDDSAYSSKTVEYDITQCENHRPVQFSPLPSTSRDNDIFVKNDKLFNESLKENKEQTNAYIKILKKEENETNVENVITTNGSDTETEKMVPKKEEIDILAGPCETIVLDDYPMPKIPNNTYHDDVEIIECNIPTKTTSSNNWSSFDDIKVVDEYKDINFTDDDSTDAVEVIDVDEIIATNQSILQKYKDKKDTKLDHFNSVIEVPNTPINVNTSGDKQSNTSTSDVISVDTNQNSTTTVSDRNSNSAQQAGDGSAIERIVNNFFNYKQNLINSCSRNSNQEKHLNVDPNIFTSLLNSLKNKLSSMQTVLPSRVEPINFDIDPEPSQKKHQKGKSSENSANREKQSPQTSKNQENTPVAPPTRNFGECPICLEALANVGIASTICGHVFCLKCIQTAIKSNGKKCPTCRKALKGMGYHQIYL